MSTKKYTHLFKYLILGESAVGKTCILLRYTDDSFSNTHMITIGIDFKNKIIMSGKEKIRLQIWDTAGQDRYKTVTKQFYKGAHGILLVYDITNVETFRNVRNWIEQIEQNAKSQIAKILVGNKCDLEEDRQVTKAEGRKLADEFNMNFYETSAAKNVMISEVFESMTGELLKSLDLTKDNAGNGKEEESIVINFNKPEKAGCCGGTKAKDKA